ncbi:MAG: S-methyl-5-thioribose-1-phosphate isomerase [Polyangiaceae bacterium]|nr:S-methyl-5-thioribose-1-phosphate isomerase [Polyangiaceae bacterium]
MLPHPSPLSQAHYSAAELSLDDTTLLLLDQRRLPVEETYVEIRDVGAAAEAIRELVVRGAPAIGVAAGYAMVLAAREAASAVDFAQALEPAARLLVDARPTAVNLRWAVDRMRSLARELGRASAAERRERFAAEARAIHRADVEANRTLGRLGAERVPDGATVLTHCNAGALATGGYGTALGVIRAAIEAGKQIRVLADETRPVLQGARLTAWELARDGIPVTVITDSMAGARFAAGRIDLVVVGADRIARNGDVANKIGTYGVACLARMHDRPFYVAAPFSTVDLETPTGAAIPIEERRSSEVTHAGAVQHVPAGVAVWNPSFDVTPARLVTAIFTERGAADPAESIACQG